MEGHEIFVEIFKTVLGTNIPNLWQRENLFRLVGNGNPKLGPLRTDYQFHCQQPYVKYLSMSN